MKLISMTDFFFEIAEIRGVFKNETEKNNAVFLNFEKLLKYANFLKQPLTLGMFVPCDNNGNPYDEDGTDGEGYVIDQIMFKEYQQAKARVLFENINVKKGSYEFNHFLDFGGGEYLTFRISKNEFIHENGNIINTLEDLAKYYNLTLTESAIKQIGL